MGSQINAPFITPVDAIRANIPTELLDLAQWVVWKFEQRPGEKKPTKILYNPATGQRADSTDPRTWATFADASNAYERGDYAGLGFVVTDDDPYVGVDLDGCIVDGGLTDNANRWLLLLDSYTEITPSGVGVRVWVRGKKPGGRCKNAKLGVEIYETERFFTVTGNRLMNMPTTINDRQSELEALYNEVFPPNPTNDKHREKADNVSSAVLSMDDQELINRMLRKPKVQALWDGDMSAYADDHSSADLALCNELAFYTNGDIDRIDRLFRQSGLYRDKWERQDYRDRTINKAIESCTGYYDPVNYRSNGAVDTAIGDVDGDNEQGNTTHAVVEVMTLAQPVPKRTEAPTGDGGDGGDDSKQTDSGKPKQADLLYKLAMERATFFTGRQDGQVYASVTVDGHRECYRMRTTDFNDWLAYTYYTQYGTTVSAQATEDCKKLLSFEAKKNIDDVFVRVGHRDGKVYIDLGSAEHDAIEVDENGWRIVETPPVHFRRANHALPLPLPVDCPDPLILGKYLNINEEDWPLLAGWLVAAIHPRGPYPILALLSRAGSGKSTALRVLKRVIDPSSAELRAEPNDVRDLFIAASNSWLLAFDNVSRVSSEVSDALCVVSTGGGFTKRANYTDGDEHVINVQRPIVINGIGDVISRDDLMQRAIVVGTPKISEEQRRDENEFWQEFEQDRPRILGAILHALSVGLANINSVTLEKKPRMADFAKLAVAAESAYTDGKHGFMEAYTNNREEAAETILENSPLADVLRRLVLVSGELKLKPEELFKRLEVEAKDYEKASRGWPTAPNKMKNLIDRIAPALEHTGTSATYKYIKGKRIWHIKRTNTG